ncbi:polyamine aminopropyltransferase [Dictyoglomus thermophilum]|uniref:Polyamine aminopropyltransferase n=2 Tax=Dictyoglomus thermophilum TaxID=14 RepID=B5YF61_DICT6|nr:polyamine aminopropyltransferase [Dictyoglomus thermophilum]ACI18269.1 spermidine synthase 2 [Dictyoglomus thermophilum H-6-12]MCX7719914.1 polyamine aminopropyltransferase [Dictyoglomus thermophilum]TYT22637.1 polyamine aminopropyltransferase [Dictyoglomus thermophilum]
MDAYWIIEKNHPSEIHWHGVSRFYYTGVSPFQKIEVIESSFYGKCLVLDGRIQSSEKDEFIYHEALVHPALLLNNSNRKKVLIMGGGEGATLREVLRHKDVEEAIMVDIDGEVVEVSKEYLPEWHQGAFEDPRTKLYITDAREFVERAEEKYDVIISDLSEPMEGSPAVKLFTYEFYNIIKEHLKEDGVFVMQAGTTHHLKIFFHAAMSSTLRRVFKIVRSYQAYVPAYDFIWSFIWASDKIDPKNFSEEDINNLIKAKGLENLRFYDGEAHKMMFSLPKHIRELIEREEKVAYDSAPLYAVED